MLQGVYIPIPDEIDVLDVRSRGRQLRLVGRDSNVTSPESSDRNNSEAGARPAYSCSLPDVNKTPEGCEHRCLWNGVDYGETSREADGYSGGSSNGHCEIGGRAARGNSRAFCRDSLAGLGWLTSHRKNTGSAESKHLAPSTVQYSWDVTSRDSM